MYVFFFFFFQAEDGIRDGHVTGVQTCALPISVQVKVKILKPDEFLRPEMNASVAFIAEEKPVAGGSAASHAIVVPASAVRNDRSEERRVGKECRSRGGEDE